MAYVAQTGELFIFFIEESILKIFFFFLFRFIALRLGGLWHALQNWGTGS